MSYLFERDDFAAMVALTAERRDIAEPAIVEKDYYVTEALRVIAGDFGGWVVFKGGTSLSKGWNLIQRFSEDIDLFVRPAGTEAETECRFQRIAQAIAAFPGFRRHVIITGNSKTWTEEFEYETQQIASPVRSIVLLEAGVQSADQPTEARPLISMLGEELNRAGAAQETDDRSPFEMPLLHFRRTFVEKLFALHTAVVKSTKSGRGIGKPARHYYDVAKLAAEPEVDAMLGSTEYAAICREYRQLTGHHFPEQLACLPDRMDLSGSPALFPDAELKAKLAKAYAEQCGRLCFGEFPSFDEVLAVFEAIKDRLRVGSG